MDNLEETLKNLDILEKKGWEHYVNVGQLNKGVGSLSNGESFSKKFSDKKTILVTLQRLIKPNPEERKTTLPNFKKRIEPTVGWRITNFLDKGKGLTYLSEGDIDGYNSYKIALDCAINFMYKIESLYASDFTNNKGRS